MARNTTTKTCLTTKASWTYFKRTSPSSTSSTNSTTPRSRTAAVHQATLTLICAREHSGPSLRSSAGDKEQLSVSERPGRNRHPKRSTRMVTCLTVCSHSLALPATDQTNMILFIKHIPTTLCVSIQVTRNRLCPAPLGLVGLSGQLACCILHYHAQEFALTAISFLAVYLNFKRSSGFQIMFAHSLAPCLSDCAGSRY